MPIFKTFMQVEHFLKAVQPALEADEAANNLMYGLALQISRAPERFRPYPFFGVVRVGFEVLAAAIMTPPHNLVVFSTPGNNTRDVFVLIARSLRDADWPVPGVLGPNEAALAFAQGWREITKEAFELKIHERVYELREVIPPPKPSGGMRLAQMDELELAAQWLVQFHQEAMPDDGVTLEEARETLSHKIADELIYVWDDGQPVAMAGQTRPTPNGCCIGPVYTPPDFRRKGYASALTAALSQRLLDSGKKFTALFTDLANPTSNSIYQRIGYRPVCDFDSYAFLPAQR
jgi:predicted GNAT family acetyltransferase